MGGIRRSAILEYLHIQKAQLGQEVRKYDAVVIIAVVAPNEEIIIIITEIITDS